MEEDVVNQNNATSNYIPEDEKPISTWAFVGYQILFAIPCVGLICAIVFAFGSGNNKNLKNYARANLFMVCIAVVLALILFLIFGVALGSLIYNSAQSSIY